MPENKCQKTNAGKLYAGKSDQNFRNFHNEDDIELKLIIYDTEVVLNIYISTNYLVCQ